jgi:hypothetical protein
LSVTSLNSRAGNDVISICNQHENDKPNINHIHKAHTHTLIHMHVGIPCRGRRWTLRRSRSPSARPLVARAWSRAGCCDGGRASTCETKRVYKHAHMFFIYINASVGHTHIYSQASAHIPSGEGIGGQAGLSDSTATAVQLHSCAWDFQQKFDWTSSCRRLGILGTPEKQSIRGCECFGR